MHPVRKHIRLRNYDYSSEGYYFITICTAQRKCFFGYIENGIMILNDIGKIANEYLLNIPNHFKNALLDEFIVMPNHIHMILGLNYDIRTRNGESQEDHKSQVRTRNGESQEDHKSQVRTRHGVSQQAGESQKSQITNKFGKPIKNSISVIINQYKSSVKRWCNSNNHEYFKWQPRFHDHIIRNDGEYKRIKQYIINNPSNWKKDKLSKK